MSWRKHFRIVNTNSKARKADQTDIVVQRGGAISASYSSYLPLVFAGHPNRIQRYYQYEDMDRDSDITAALDLIADFCTQKEEQDDQPFEVNYTEEANETEVKLIKTYLQKWCKLNNFRSSLWYMFRNCIKAGDQFFLRDPETSEWLWVDHFNVELVKVDETQGKKPDEYVVRNLDYNKQVKFATTKADPSQYRTPLGINVGLGSSSRPAVNATQTSPFSLAGASRDPRQINQINESMVIDAKHVIHLSLSVGMDINWPFGASILEPIFKVYKQRELLEDSVIIYRVQRAPERRIFYIDCGNMPAPKANAHVERIKNEIHQRRIPNRTSTGGSILDAAYNPLNLLEDYFFSQNCISMQSKIVLLDGRTLSLAEIIEEHNAGKINYVYAQNRQTNELEPGKIVWAGATRRNAQVMKITLDNGDDIVTTPDHRFILRDGSEVEAQHLIVGSSLMPLYLLPGRSGPKQKVEKYTRYICNATRKKKFVHTTICPKPSGREHVVHHRDFCSLNNNPDNLEVMTWYEHEALHKAVGTYSLSKQWNDIVSRAKLIAGMRRLYDEASDEFRDMLSERNVVNGSNVWKKPESAKRVLESLKIEQQKCAKSRTMIYTSDMFARMVEIYDAGYDSISKICPVLRVDERFQTLFCAANANVKRSKHFKQVGSSINDGTLSNLCRAGGYNNWHDFKQTHKNHMVISVEYLEDREDTGDITIETPSGSHIFALAAGIYIHNSEGRGSKVETLPGGELVGEIGDLEHFNRKLMRGLRVPPSYLPTGTEDSQVGYNDGKLGTAMIQEYRFSMYCQRLQNLLIPHFDREFKRYLRDNGIQIESSLFELAFHMPQNFTKYRQIEIDSAQMGVFSQISEYKHMSERFKLKRFLNMSEDDMVENERMWSEENPDKMKRKTGSTPAESEFQDDLGSVGVRSDSGLTMPTDLGGEDEMETGENNAAGGAQAGEQGAAGAGPGAQTPPAPGGSPI